MRNMIMEPVTGCERGKRRRTGGRGWREEGEEYVDVEEKEGRKRRLEKREEGVGKRCKRAKVSCETVRRVDGRKLWETKRWERKTRRGRQAGLRWSTSEEVKETGAGERVCLDV